MPQLTVKDALIAIDKLKKDIEDGNIKCYSVPGPDVDTSDIDMKLETLENEIKELKKEIREHVMLYNNHVQGLHING